MRSLAYIDDERCLPKTPSRTGVSSLSVTPGHVGKHGLVVRWSWFVFAAVVVAGCSSGSGGGASNTTGDVTAATESTVAGPAVVVAHDSNINAVKFLAKDGSILASAAVPVGFAPVRALRPSPFLYGLPIDGTLTVADALTMTATTYPVPPGLDQVVELDGTTVLLYENVFTPSSSDVVLFELGSGTITSMRDLIGRPEASGRRMLSLTDSIVLVDGDTFHSLVVPRDDPSAAWEADAVVTGQIGDTFVGVSPIPSVPGFVVHAFRGHNAIDAGGALARLNPSETAGAFLTTADQMVIADTAGKLTQIDLNSGNTVDFAQLGVAPETVQSVATTVLYATGPAGDGLFSISPLQAIKIDGHGPFINYGSGSRCALIQQSSDSFGDTKSFVIDLQSATVVAELGPEPSPLAEDGCSAVDALHKIVVLDGTIADVGGGWFFDVSLDLATVIVRGVDNVTKMLDVQTKRGIVLPPANDFFFVDT
jgi:hypothetical protein